MTSFEYEIPDKFSESKINLFPRVHDFRTSRETGLEHEI